MWCPTNVVLKKCFQISVKEEHLLNMTVTFSNVTTFACYINKKWLTLEKNSHVQINNTLMKFTSNSILTYRCVKHWRFPSELCGPRGSERARMCITIIICPVGNAVRSANKPVHVPGARASTAPEPPENVHERITERVPTVSHNWQSYRQFIIVSVISELLMFSVEFAHFAILKSIPSQKTYNILMV